MYGNFVWWQGVVEDRDDPELLGRCRVRILGYHTDNKQKIFNHRSKMNSLATNAKWTEELENKSAA